MVTGCQRSQSKDKHTHTQLLGPLGEVAGRARTNGEQLSGRRRPDGELSATGRAWDAQVCWGMGPQVETTQNNSDGASVERIGQIRRHLAGFPAQELWGGSGTRGLQMQFGSGRARSGGSNAVFHSQPLGTALGNMTHLMGGQDASRPGFWVGREQGGDAERRIRGGSMARATQRVDVNGRQWQSNSARASRAVAEAL